MATTAKAVYFLTGKGVKMYFSGSAYQDPDAAAREEGERLAKSFRNVKVVKITGTKIETIFQAPGKAERIQRNLQLYFCQR